MKYIQPTACFLPEQIYSIEQQWFHENNPSYSLMQQASWQMANHIAKHYPNKNQQIMLAVGAGNNGGDGWLVASFLAEIQPTWQICVIEIAKPTTHDSQQAKAYFLDLIKTNTHCHYQHVDNFLNNQHQQIYPSKIDIIIDAMFGIGLNRQPTDKYQQLIEFIHEYQQNNPNVQVISIDVPSGLNVSTGEVYQQVAVKAHQTLCLVARKVGLHLKDSKDFTGEIIDFPLIPIHYLCKKNSQKPIAYYHQQLPKIAKRQHNQHKGSFGYVLIIAGQYLSNGQGMAGAGLLAGSGAFASGVGKVSIACHHDFQNAIISRLPNAMTMDIHQIDSVNKLITEADGVALGMGFGRDEQSSILFAKYLHQILLMNKPCVIDADGLYHLANLSQSQDPNDQQLIDSLRQAHCYFTPHSGEMARLLQMTAGEVEADRLTALQQASQRFGGHWLLKGANSLVMENGQIHICGLGNAGMGTAGMGDTLAGLAISLIVQKIDNPLLMATLIHAKAGDILANKIGEHGLQAWQMDKAISQVLQSLH